METPYESSDYGYVYRLLEQVIGVSIIFWEPVLENGIPTTTIELLNTLYWPFVTVSSAADDVSFFGSIAIGIFIMGFLMIGLFFGRFVTLALFKLRTAVIRVLSDLHKTEEY